MAEQVGVSRQLLARRVALDGWRRVLPGVFLLPGFELTPRVWAEAIDRFVAGGGEPPRLGAVSHESAAALLGIRRSLRLPIDYVVPFGCSKRPKNARVRTARWLHAGCFATHDDVRVLDGRWVLGTLASCSPVEQLEADLATADRLRIAPLGSVRSWLATDAPRLHGLGRLRQAVDRAWSELSHSSDERIARQRLREAGLQPHPRPYLVADERGPIAEIDIAFVPERVALPVDGDHHDDPDQRRFDDEQRLRLQLLGWLVVRADRTRVRRQPQVLVRQVRAALEHQRARGFGA